MAEIESSRSIAWLFEGWNQRTVVVVSLRIVCLTPDLATVSGWVGFRDSTGLSHSRLLFSLSSPFLDASGLSGSILRCCNTRAAFSFNVTYFFSAREEDGEVCSFQIDPVARDEFSHRALSPKDPTASFRHFWFHVLPLSVQLESGFPVVQREVTCARICPGEALAVVLKSPPRGFLPRRPKKALSTKFKMLTQTTVTLQTLVLLLFLGTYGCVRASKSLWGSFLCTDKDSRALLKTCECTKWLWIYYIMNYLFNNQLNQYIETC